MITHYNRTEMTVCEVHFISDKLSLDGTVADPGGAKPHMAPTQVGNGVSPLEEERTMRIL